MKQTKHSARNESTKAESSLHIQNLELKLNLGWKEKERRTKRTVSLDIHIQFLNPPKACETDALEDTFCYYELIKHLHECTALKEFKLIEHLACYVYKLIKKHIAQSTLAKKSKVIVCITKYPIIKGLKNGVSFNYGDYK